MTGVQTWCSSDLPRATAQASHATAQAPRATAQGSHATAQAPRATAQASRVVAQACRATATSAVHLEHHVAQLRCHLLCRGSILGCAGPAATHEGSQAGGAALQWGQRGSVVRHDDLVHNTVPHISTAHQHRTSAPHISSSVPHISTAHQAHLFVRPGKPVMRCAVSAVSTWQGKQA